MKITIQSNQQNLKNCEGWECPTCHKQWYWFVECCHCGYKNDEYEVMP